MLDFHNERNDNRKLIMNTGKDNHNNIHFTEDSFLITSTGPALHGTYNIA